MFGKVMYANGRMEEVAVYLRRAYEMSERILFLEREDKEQYLPLFGIEDDRTFEDISNEY